MLTAADVSDHVKASKLMHAVENVLVSSPNPEQHLINICHALKETQNQTLKDIAKTMIGEEAYDKDVPTVVTKSSTQENIQFRTIDDEKETQKSLQELDSDFSKLMIDVETSFATEQTSDLLEKMKIWLRNSYYLADSKLITELDAATTVKKVFITIGPLYDCIDCGLIVDMSKVFIPKQQEVVKQLEAHWQKGKKFYQSSTVQQLKNDLEKIYRPHISTSFKDMPMMILKLQDEWGKNKITALEHLLGKMLPLHSKQSLLKYIEIIPGSITINYYVCDITADSLIEYAGGKLQFMRLIGIFSLYINDHAVLQEDENMNFTFELALLEAVTAGHNEAAEFLLQIETINIDHTNEEGKTALMLACEGGHEDIVHSLLSAGANVNLQDNNGWTALMRASKHNHISIINMLLQANANPQLKKSNGSNALMIASFDGHYEVVELLISIGVDYKYQREDGTNAFMLACQNGHTQIVELLLKEQVDPNVQDKNGWNAFMVACANGHTQIVELLLKKQVDPNVQSKNGWNAFMSACKNGHTQIVELLLKEQVDPNVQNKDGWNAFMVACANGHTQIVELLLKKQVDFNATDRNGHTALMAAACENSKIVELLLATGANPNAQKKSSDEPYMNGCTALMFAIYSHNSQTVQLLLKANADPNKGTTSGITPSAAAVMTRQPDMLKLLLEAGANINDNIPIYPATSFFIRGTASIPVPIADSTTANINFKTGTISIDSGERDLSIKVDITQVTFTLMNLAVLSVWTKDKGIYESFCQQLMNISLINEKEIDSKKFLKFMSQGTLDDQLETIRVLSLTSHDKDPVNLMFSAMSGNTQVLDLLLKAGYDLYQPLSSSKYINQIFSSPQELSMLDLICPSLIAACNIGHLKVFQLLLKVIGDPNVQQKNGETLLMIASYCGHLNIVQTLLENGADPNICDNIGNNALHHALLSETSGKGSPENTQIVELLLKEQVDPNVQNKNGWNAFMLACQNGHTQIVELLLKEQVDPNVQDKNGWNAFMVACQNGHPQIVELLLKKQVDPNVQSKNGWNAFMSACKNGHTQIVELLLKKQVDPNVQSKNGWNAFMSACKNGHTQIVELLLKEQVDPNVQNKDGWNAFMVACANGHTQIVELLLKKQVDFNATDRNGHTALMAAACENSKIVELLLATGANPNVQKKSSDEPYMNGCTALMFAIYSHNSQTVQLLLKANADPNKGTTSGITPSAAAVMTRQPDMLKLLLEAGANINDNIPIYPATSFFIRGTASIPVPIADSTTANINFKTGTISIDSGERDLSIKVDITQVTFTLMNLAVVSVWMKDKGIYESFCQQNIALINEKEIDSKKFLEFMSQGTLDDQLETIRVLSLTSHDKDPVNLMFSAMSGNAQVLDLLLKAGYDLYQPLSSSKYFNQIFSSPQELPMLDFICPSLIAACNIGHLKVFQLLLKAIGDPNVQQKDGVTLLMIASYCGHLNIVQTLLENGADPNICDNNGDNALHAVLLSKESKLDIAQTQMSWKINANKQNNGGVTPLMIASSKGYIEVILLLLSNADPNITDSKGSTALMYACKNGHYEVAALLLMTYNADPSLTDNNGLTALHYAAKGGYNEVINVLLSNYDYNQEEIEKALTAACYGGHKEVIKELADKANLKRYQKDIVTACISDDVAYIVSDESSDLSLPLIESTGLTPLMLASSCGSDGVVQVLLSKFGADVNKQDNYQQYSPLLYAVSGSKSVAMVQYLIDSDANVNVITSDEQTPLDFAIHYKLNDIAELLEGKGGKVYSSIMEVAIEEIEVPLSIAQKVNNIQTTLTKLAAVATSVNMTSFNAPSFSPTPFLPQIPLISAC